MGITIGIQTVQCIHGHSKRESDTYIGARVRQSIRRLRTTYGAQDDSPAKQPQTIPVGETEIQGPLQEGHDSALNFYRPLIETILTRHVDRAKTKHLLTSSSGVRCFICSYH